MPVPVKVSEAVLPASVERRALPPLWFATGEVLVNHEPENTTRGSESSIQRGVGVGVGR
jgi:hypothetical protein